MPKESADISRYRFVYQVHTQETENEFGHFLALYTNSRNAIRHVIKIAGKWSNVKEIKLCRPSTGEEELLPVPKTSKEQGEFYAKYSEILSTTMLTFVTLSFTVHNPRKLHYPQVFTIRQQILTG